MRGQTAKTGAGRRGGGSWETRGWGLGDDVVGAGRRGIREKK